MKPTPRAAKAKTTRPQKAFEKAVAATPAGKYFLRLYVAGATDRSRQALRKVYQICELELNSNYELEVIDVYQQPELARKNQIVATPTLVRESPLPVRRIIGNFSDATTIFGDSGQLGKGSPAL